MEVYAAFLLVVAFMVFLLKSLFEDKYFYPVEFVLITLAGYIAYPQKENWTIWDIFLSVGGGATLALSFLALLGYLDYIRKEDKVEIFFEYDDDSIPTGLTVLRKNCTRAEVQGLLRILSEGTLFRMGSVLKDKEILNLVDEIQTGEKKKLVLKIEKSEIIQFVNLPDYENILKKYTIIKENKEVAFFNIKTQKQIDYLVETIQKIEEQCTSSSPTTSPMTNAEG